MPTIVVDSRESRSGLALELRALGVEVIPEELECGDYVLSAGVAVERKAASDFVMSILDKRIFSQLATMKVTYARPLLIVEGDIFNTRSEITEDALLGAMSYISLLEGVPILNTSGTKQTAKLLNTLTRHAVGGLGYEIAFRGGKPKDRFVQAKYITEGLPGVGPSAASKLLAHFGSVHALMGATAEDLTAVAGIGKKTATAIREVLEFDTRLITRS